MTDLEKAFAELSKKAGMYSTLFQYADGDQPLVYSTERLKQAFQNINARFTQNWCSVVIDSALDRITFKGWALKDKGLTDRLNMLFAELEMSQDAQDAHRSALITRESYVIAWKNSEGEIEFNYNDPRLCHMFYMPDNRKKVDFAAKWYKDGSVYKMILYYRDRLEYYVTDTIKNVPTSAKAFKVDASEYTDGKAENTFGEIPMFHFYTSRNGKGDLYNIITLQDAVNKLLSDMMTAAEFVAINQRYVITTADTKVLKNAPNEIWQLPEGSQAGSFPAANLDNFLVSMDKLANSIAVISRTPKHYFYSAGSAISGEALLAMEAPLTKKVDQRIESFSSTWRKIGAFLLKLDGVEVSPIDITPVFIPSESVQPKTEAETSKVWVDQGVPLKTALSWAGKTDEEITEMEKDKAEEQKKGATVAKQLLEAARIRQEQDNQEDDVPETTA